MPRTNEPGRSVSSRLLDVLFAFGPDRRALTLADLSRQTGLPHPTVRRLALELVEAGALSRDEAGRFAIGMRLWELATLAPRTESLRSLAQPFMEDLFAALRQHVQLAVLENDEAVIIDRLSAPRAVGVTSRVGGRLPLHASGVGKVLLAHADPDLVEELLSRRLRSYTRRTQTDPQALRRELAACRATGLAVVHGELTPEADSVATRILDADGHVVAALSVVVSTGSIRLGAVQPTVHACGAGVSRLLGWRPGTPVRTGRTRQGLFIQ
jgi:DNA-binding IclR family transcriptional regulator